MPNFVNCVTLVKNTQTGQSVFKPKTAQQIKDVINGTARFIPERMGVYKEGGVASIANELPVTISDAWRATALSGLKPKTLKTAPDGVQYFENRFTGPLTEEEIKAFAKIPVIPPKV